MAFMLLVSNYKYNSRANISPARYVGKLISHLPTKTFSTYNFAADRHRTQDLRPPLEPGRSGRHVKLVLPSVMPTFLAFRTPFRRPGGYLRQNLNRFC